MSQKRRVGVSKDLPGGSGSTAAMVFVDRTQPEDSSKDDLREESKCKLDKAENNDADWISMFLERID
eukprot:6466323-Amphidinium_carterae.1